MKADTITKAYVQNADIFADIFNYYVYKGRHVIHPEQLAERNSAELALPYGADGASIPVQRFRDVQKLYAVMTDGKAQYILLGAENQSNIHYAMPVRNNLYDALEYAGQVEEAARSHRTEMKKHSTEISGSPNSDEFLSGFWKNDRLIPSITVTIYFGADAWDGPLNLFDMMDVSDPGILANMDNYRLRLIAPAQMSDEEIMKFQSSLREVLFFIKYSKDSEKLETILKTNKKRFQCLERRAADVIKIITGANLKYREKEETIDMCQAIQDLIQRSKTEGQQEGRQEGRQEGIAEGLLKGKKETALVMNEKGFSIDMISDILKVETDILLQWFSESAIVN